MVGETAKRKRGPFLGLPVMLMILLRNTRFGATTSIFKDNATSPYHGRMDEPEYWMFDSEISRMLAGQGARQRRHYKPESTCSSLWPR
jgi:hypothetical protein